MKPGARGGTAARSLSEKGTKTMIQKLYSLNEVEKITGVKVRTLRVRLKEGTLKACKLSGKWRVTEDDLKAFIQAAPTNIPTTE